MSRRAKAEPDVTPAPATSITLGELWPDEAKPARPMALTGEAPSEEGSEAATSETPVPAWGAPPVAAGSKRSRETYAEDIPLALIAAVLAGSVFLPWYKGPRGFSLSVTAWESGTWGPIIFFLAAGSVLLVILRRVGLAVALPIEESLFHEGAGWISLAGAVIKSRFRPGTSGLLGLSFGLWVAIGAAVLLIVVAGRMSPHAPLVLRPGWFKGRAGTLGVALLLVIVGGAAAFAKINSASLLLQPPATHAPGVVTGRLPDCARGFALPAGVRPVQGGENPCQVQLSSEKPASDVLAAFKADLQRTGATFTELRTAGAPSIIVTKPGCLTIVVVGAEGGSVAVIAFDICATPGPTPSPTRT